MAKKLKKRHIILISVMVFMILSFWKWDVVSQILGFLFSLICPFLIAGTIAFIVNVPMTAIENFLFRRNNQKKQVSIKISRPISLLLALVCIIFVLVFAFLVILPQIQDTIKSLVVKTEAFLPKLEVILSDFFNGNKEVITFIESLRVDTIIDSFWTYLRTGIVNIFGSTITVASSVVSTITQIFVALIFAIYILLQKELLAIQFLKVFHAFWDDKKIDKTIKILSLTKNTFSKFISGQCLEAVILGVLFVIVLSLFKIPFALLIGIIVGFSSIIPIIGAFFGAGVGTFLILIEDPMTAVYFLIIFLIIQQLEGNLIYPRVVGDSIGLPAMWVLAAVSIGGALMGVAGILLFIPLTSVAYSLFREYVNNQLKENEITP